MSDTSKRVRGSWHPFETAPASLKAMDAVLTDGERYDRGVIEFAGTDADGSVLLIGRDAVDGAATVWGWMPQATW